MFGRSRAGARGVYADYAATLFNIEASRMSLAAQVAQASGVDFIDLNQMIAERYHALGQEKVQLLFCSASDNVHTSPAGAELNAACVVDGLKRLSGRPLELCFRTE